MPTCGENNHNSVMAVILSHPSSPSLPYRDNTLNIVHELASKLLLSRSHAGTVQLYLDYNVNIPL